MNVEGMTPEYAAARWGVSRRTAIQRASRQGVRIVAGRFVRNASVYEVEDEIAARLAVKPPSAPCVRCGARICDHERIAA